MNVKGMLNVRPLGVPFLGPPVVTAAGGVTFNIPLTFAPEAPMRQNRGKRDRINISHLTFGFWACAVFRIEIE